MRDWVRNITIPSFAAPVGWFRAIPATRFEGAQLTIALALSMINVTELTLRGTTR